MAGVEAPPRAGDGSTTVSLAITGMTCGSCATRLERRLNGVDGVDARVNFATERARVVVARDISTEQVIEAVEAAGFKATMVGGGRPSISDTSELDRRVRSLGRRLVVSAGLLMPLCDLTLLFWLFPKFRFAGWQAVLLVLAFPVVTWAAWPFYVAAIRSARHGTTSMDTLVSLGIAAATAWSLYAMFWLAAGHQGGTGDPFTTLRHLPGGATYLDVAAGVTTFLLAGRYFEALCRRRSSGALQALAEVAAHEVSVLDAGGMERRLPAELLEVGDRFVVRPGETVATDGVVEEGRAAVDQSAMTGESAEVDVTEGSKVIGGTISLDGRLTVRATRVGEETQLAQMLRLVEEAQDQKANVQRLADRVSAIFVPTVLVLAAITLAGWLAAGSSPEQAFEAALCVLIIACPCALGLATPMALFVASGRGARLGIFFKGYQALEASRQIDTVLLDKTGTVTEGRMSVVEVRAGAGRTSEDVLRLAGAVEQGSEHLVGRAIAAAATVEVGPLLPAEEFRARPGLGAEGLVEGIEIAVGRAELMREGDASTPPELAEASRRWGELGRTVVYVACGREVVGAIALADTTKRSARAAVDELHRLGLRCVLLTGDNERAARTVADEIGVSDVVAGALPVEKVALVHRLQQEGRAVAVVGDGINDGPALAAADLGLAVGSGTDVAIKAADLIILRDDLRVVATAIELSRRTLRVIHGNLVWAFAYNLAAIPLAACGLLNPLIAGAAMALSSTFVVWNSSRLRHVGTAQPAHEDDEAEDTLTRDALPDGTNSTRSLSPVG